MELEEDGPEAAGAPLSPAMELEEDGPGAAGTASHRCCWNLLSTGAGGPLSPPLELEELEEAGGGVGGLVQVHDLAVLAVEDLQVAVVNGEPVQVPTYQLHVREVTQRENLAELKNKPASRPSSSSFLPLHPSIHLFILE